EPTVPVPVVVLPVVPLVPMVPDVPWPVAVPLVPWAVPGAVPCASPAGPDWPAVCWARAGLATRPAAAANRSILVPLMCVPPFRMPRGAEHGDGSGRDPRTSGTARGGLLRKSERGTMAQGKEGAHVPQHPGPLQLRAADHEGRGPGCRRPVRAQGDRTRESLRCRYRSVRPRGG